MPNQMTFQRYELKYLLNRAQQKRLLQIMQSYMKQDAFAHATIRNIYYDTDSFLLARRSIEKPVYKEKLRVRSYTLPTPDTAIFVELKKKSESIVYKRRIELPYQELCKFPIHALPASGGIPLWMSRFLSDEQIYRTSFSKYGTAYEQLIITKNKGEQKYA